MEEYEWQPLVYWGQTDTFERRERVVRLLLEDLIEEVIEEYIEHVFSDANEDEGLFEDAARMPYLIYESKFRDYTIHSDARGKLVLATVILGGN